MGSLGCSIERLTDTQISNTNALLVLTYAIQQRLFFRCYYWIEAHLLLRAMGSRNISANTTMCTWSPFWIEFLRENIQFVFLIHVSWMKDSRCLVNTIQWFVNIWYFYCCCCHCCCCYCCVYISFSFLFLYINSICNVIFNITNTIWMLHLTKLFIHTRIQYTRRYEWNA